ncbi:MAG: hypothetical protein QW795_08880 [Candidatus Bathyarchaeia archaeon]
MSRGIDCNEYEKKVLLHACKKLSDLGLETEALEKAINTKNIEALKAEMKRLYKIANFDQKEMLEKLAFLFYTLWGEKK